MVEDTSILIIYTGGTIGMIENPETGALSPLDFNQITLYLPELKKFDFHIDAISFDPPLDSSDIEPDIWVNIATIIHERYDEYTGFVILHGTDTMAYTASALSFILENLTKPVILTGSQLPIGILRTDGKENIITALEIASGENYNSPVIPEVCIYFENKLFRGNRTHKHNAEYFNAFRSDNYPPLAEAGIHINYNELKILPLNINEPFKIHTNLDSNIAVLRIFPGINFETVKSISTIKNLKGLIIESYGEGNALTASWFIKLVENAINKDIVVLSVTQCAAGKVDLGKYQTSRELMQIGVISGYDITIEAALTKLMYLFGKDYDNEKIKELLVSSLRGEISI